MEMGDIERINSTAIIIIDKKNLKAPSKQYK